MAEIKSLPSWERGLKFLQILYSKSLSSSLPSWERGLKHSEPYSFKLSLMSLPSWERGLKQNCCIACRIPVKSLPSWERGLKHFIGTKSEVGDVVAPFVGAWIETYCRSSVDCTLQPSLPSWERGLKRFNFGKQIWIHRRSLRGSVD